MSKQQDAFDKNDRSRRLGDGFAGPGVGGEIVGRDLNALSRFKSTDVRNQVIRIQATGVIKVVLRPFLHRSITQVCERNQMTEQTPAISREG